MDKIYTNKDIPSDFVYPRFYDDYIDLYNTQYIRSNGVYPYYRIYYKYSPDLYEYKTLTTGSYQSTIELVPYQTSSDIMDRPDFMNILVVTTILALCFLVLFNLFTSAFKKGGLFSGLL